MRKNAVFGSDFSWHFESNPRRLRSRLRWVSRTRPRGFPRRKLCINEILITYSKALDFGALLFYGIPRKTRGTQPIGQFSSKAAAPKSCQASNWQLFRLLVIDPAETKIGPLNDRTADDEHHRSFSRKTRWKSLSYLGRSTGAPTSVPACSRVRACLCACLPPFLCVSSSPSDPAKN